MSKKQFKTGSEARQALLKGVQTLSDIVTCTLGPRGRNVALEKKWIYPIVINDGVSIAKEIDLPDPFEDIGAQLVKEASMKTNDRAGDGTTTATLLACTMIERGMELIEKGANPGSLKKGMDFAVEKVVEELKNMSKPVDTREKIAQVATVSSGDPKIGELIADAMDKIGKDGTIAVEESSAVQITVEIKSGLEYDKGYCSSYYVTNTDTMSCELDSVLICITDQKLVDAQEMMVFLKRVLEAGYKQILFICDGIDGGALETLNVNVLDHRINGCAVYAPGFAERRVQMLEDLAILTGGTVIRKELSKTLENTQIEDLGRADKIWVDENTTKVIGPQGDKTKIDQRIAQLKKEIDKAEDEWEKEKIKERLAKISGGAALIKVGAPTEQEMKEKKERVFDAVAATKAAMEEGIIAGGGIVLQSTGHNMIFDNYEDSLSNEDELYGYELVRDSLNSPLEKILSNAGVDVKAVEEEIRLHKPPLGTSYGYNVETEKYGDMFEMGIVDPVKVTRSALQNAASVASIILSTQVLVVNLPEKGDSNEANKL